MASDTAESLNPPEPVETKKPHFLKKMLLTGGMVAGSLVVGESCKPIGCADIAPGRTQSGRYQSER